ncbi:MAG: pilus assembly protein PilM [Candidatus Pacebacteria bacterium]|nr:pilus assembly protein PilM [Candidatus Paceibacterota bacterium]
MIRNISIGIDVGTTTTRVVVGEFLKGEKNPKILGIGEAPTLGMRHGYVTHDGLVTDSIKKAVAIAENSSGIKIKKAFISIGSVTLRGDTSSGSTIISKADGEVTTLDVTKAIEDSENNLTLGNKKIIQVFPISFKLDGKEILGRPEGMRGTKLEVKTLFATCGSQHLEDLLSSVAEAGVEPIDVIATPIAGSMVALTERQKVVGSLLVNIGSETVSIAVFENGSPIALHTFSIGSSDITNDIALGLKISLEEAESLKLGNLPEKYPKKKLDEIMEARLSDIFELIENNLRKIKRNELLPAGISFIGGGAMIPKLEELSKSELSLPSRVGTNEIFASMKTKLKDPSWFVALGLVLYKKEGIGYQEGSSGSIMKDIKNTIKSITRQLLP